MKDTSGEVIVVDEVIDGPGLEHILGAFERARPTEPGPYISPAPTIKLGDSKTISEMHTTMRDMTRREMAKLDGRMQAFSKRGFPFLDQIPTEGHIVTLENYEKWYRIYILDHCGVSTPIDPALIEEVCGTDTLWIDHDFHPTLLLRLAKRLGASVSPVTLETAAGRWSMAEHPVSIPFCYFLED